MKADYSKIAETYDQAHLVSDAALERILKFLRGKMGTDRQVNLLDLGCGTGRFAIPIAKCLGYSVVGADKSPEMLTKAKAKVDAERVTWDVQDAGALSYGNNQFDVVFMSHLLHHFDRPDHVIRECHRVLAPGGLLLNRYGAIEDIIDDPEHKFFPEIRKIDQSRTPTKKQVEDWFKQIDFEEISSETLEQQTFCHPEERARAIEKRYISALWLISDSGIETGLKDLRKYIASNPDDNWLLTCKITFTHGTKLY